MAHLRNEDRVTSCIVTDRRALVVEDDASVAKMLCDLLKGEGFSTEVESDGESGLRSFRDRGAELVLVDMLLPRLRGIDVIAQIRATPGGQGVPVIVISGVFKLASHWEELIDNHGIAAFLDKPIDMDELVDVLHEQFPSLPSRRERSPSTLARSNSELRHVPMKGEFRDVSFARLIGLLFQQKVSGALMLRRGTVKKIVYFQEGIPVFVKSNLLSECLGRVMVAERLITQEECDDSLARKRREPTLRQGEILVEMGSISPHNLSFALELQMQTKLLEVFSWLEGTFQLDAWPNQPVPHIALSMSPATLIYEGTTRTMSLARVKGDARVLKDEPLVQSSELSFRDELEELDARAGVLADLVDGTRSFDDLLEACPLEPKNSAFALYALWAAGMVRPASGVSDGFEDEQTGSLEGDSEVVFDDPSLGELPSEHEANELVDPSAYDAAPLVLEAVDEGTSLFEPDSDEETGVRAERTKDGPVESTTLEDNPSAGSMVEQTDEAPPMSDQLREQIRERLMRETDRLLFERAPPPRPATPVPSWPERAVRDQERAQLIAELEGEISVVEQQDYFERLGLSPNAGLAEVEAAFALIRQRVDPDEISLVMGSHRLRLLAEHRANLFRRAFEMLADPALHALYVSRKNVQDDHKRAVAWEAEEAFETGRALVEEGEEHRARPLLEQALAELPDDPLVVAYAAYARHREAPDDDAIRDEALTALERGAQAVPDSAPLSWFKAGILLARGESQGARGALENVLGVDPDHRPAQEALRKLVPSTERKTGLFSRWSLRG